MKRVVLYPLVVVLLAVIVLPVAMPAASAKLNVRHTIIAASGSAAPAGGHFFAFLHVALNISPEVVFDSFLTGPSFTGVFVSDATNTSAIALGGNPDPAAGNFGGVFDPFITPNHHVVFNADNTDFFVSDGRTIVPIVRNGDQAPGGGTLTPHGIYSANHGGTIVYVADVIGSTATQGIFRTDGTQTVTIARDDVVTPTGGRFTSLRSPVINDRGQAAFTAEMDGGSAEFGVFRGEGGDLTPIFVANQTAPGGGTFMDFGEPFINSHGQVAAVGVLSNSASTIGMFVGDGTNTVAIALQGQPAPKGGNYVSRLAFAQPARINDRGEVAFHVGLTGGTNSEGIFRGNGERTTTIALAGSVAPGTTGTFHTFGDIALLNNGRVAFIGTLDIGIGGVDSSNNMGIWIGTSDEDLQLVVRTGEVIDGSVLTRLPTQLGQFDMNENSLAWIGNFQSPARAVVFSRILGEE